jgi:hypothetical protein
MIDQLIQIDNFLSKPDEVRAMALKMKYTASDETTGWKGFRALEQANYNDKLVEVIKEKVDGSLYNSNFDTYFHYTLESTKKDTPSFNKSKIHRDSGMDYAGVIYLNPNPQPNSGTVFYDDNYSIIHKVENVYNRFVFYPSRILHAVEDTFGDNIENGRLTFTIFVGLPQKKTKSLL